jgi:death-on-curing protein
MTWQWLRQDVVIAIHDEQIAAHGGRSGLRDAGLLVSALARSQNQSEYGGETSAFDLAAAYAFGIIMNHPFVDGNKRTGLLAAYVFLNLNGWELMASEVEAVEAVLALVEGEINEAGMSNWFKEHSLSAVDRGSENEMKEMP